ncbi:unnamed protein product [Toxocara canis]|uniref:Uncharacterized protein n=1 Tax=Toxocara canis TaxID=6265 RepID=A0A3P7FGB3_TOXCA|nr:unnamed protein product [Toxocara canis]
MFSFGVLFYGIVLVGCYVLFELGKWRYSEVPTEIYFYRLGNGPVAAAVFIVQATMFSTAYAGFRGPYHETILIVSIVLSGASVLACAICAFCATLACLRASYILHHRATGSSTALVAPLEDNYDVQRIYTYSTTPQRQHPPMQQMEEQSVYWSTDENPYYYQTSKRYYGQPYYIESGFHGYALAHPHLNGSTNVGIDNFRQRHMNSSAAQTRIGHAFD